jgi:hypothetical protein
MKNSIELGISGNINEFKFAVETTLQEKIKSNLMEKKAEVAKTLFSENCGEYKPFHGDKQKEEKAKKFADQYKKKRDAYRELMAARKANEEVEIEEDEQGTLTRKITNRVGRINKGLAKLKKKSGHTDIQGTGKTNKETIRKGVSKMNKDEINDTLSS